MASLKNRAGATVHRFQSHCEKIIEKIDRKNRTAVGDWCVDCGTAHLILTMTEDGYKCDECLSPSSKIGLVGINDLGKIWSF